MMANTVSSSEPPADTMPRSNRIADSSNSLYPDLDQIKQERPPLSNKPVKYSGPECDLVLVFRGNLGHRGHRFLQNLESINFQIKVVGAGAVWHLAEVKVIS